MINKKKRKERELQKELSQEYRRECNSCNSIWFFTGKDISSEQYKSDKESLKMMYAMGSMLSGRGAGVAFIPSEQKEELERCKECGSRNTIIIKSYNPIEEEEKLAKMKRERDIDELKEMARDGVTIVIKVTQTLGKGLNNIFHKAKKYKDDMSNRNKDNNL